MKSLNFFLLLAALFAAIDSALIAPSIDILRDSELKNTTGNDIAELLMDNNVEGDCSSSTSLTDSPTCSGTNTPSLLKESTSSIGTLESSPSTESEQSPRKVSFSPSTVSPAVPSTSDFDQKLIALDEALHQNSKATLKLLSSISDWKRTHAQGNFSALSLLSRRARKRFEGSLMLKDPLTFFRDFVYGSHRKLAAGYFVALSMFHPIIQSGIIGRIVENAPHLRGIVLLKSIYFKLNEAVIQSLFDSGSIINFDEPEDYYPLGFLPSFSKPKGDFEFQIPVSKSFFMNFRENGPLLHSEWASKISTEPETNFLYGMMESVITTTEIGALRIAFENYKPEIVTALIEACPSPVMANYHLAHLLAKNPEKQAGYPQFESLVDSQIVFDRLSSGFSDLIALAYLSRLSASDQVSIIAEFLSKTKIFSPTHLSVSQTTTEKTDTQYNNETAIYELPNNPADVFFLTACKSNISDAAFALIWNVCKNITTKPFLIAKKKALEIATTENMLGKIGIMNN